MLPFVFWDLDGALDVARTVQRIGGLPNQQPSTRSYPFVDKLSGPLRWGHSYLVAPDPILYSAPSLIPSLWPLAPCTRPCVGGCTRGD